MQNPNGQSNKEYFVQHYGCSLYLYMLTSKNIEPAQAASYYSLEDGYYASKNNPQPSQWWGKLTQQLGLEGEVKAHDLIHILHGNAPNGIRMRGHKHSGKTRAATDLVFSAPKSVSIQALAKGDLRLVEVHKRAVNSVLTVIEQQYSIARVRTGGQQRREVTGKLLVAQFLHLTSRELDPQLHSHSLVMNALYCGDDKWRSLSNEGFYRDNKRALGVMYQQELARNVEQLGYQVQWQANDTFEIEGYSRAQILEFSQRRRQIEQVVKSNDATWQDYQEASLKTRKTKQHQPLEELQNDWQRRSAGVGIPFPVQTQVASDIEQQQGERIAEKPKPLNVSKLRGIPELAEAILEQQTLEDVTLAMAQVSLKLERKDRYPRMKELAGWIGELGQQQELQNSDLAQHLNALSRKLEQLKPPPIPWVGLQTLAEVLRERSQLEVMAEQMEQIEALQQKVEHWVQKQKLSEVQKLAEQPTAALAGTEVTYEQKVEWLRPLHIAQDHWQELILESRIKPSVAYDHYRSLDGEQAREHLLSWALGQVGGHGQQYVTHEVKRFLEHYEHLAEGGLWCDGVHVHGESWGQLKPNTPLTETKESGRLTVKLKSGEILELSKPENDQGWVKVRQYESIPKGPGKAAQSLLSHYCFCDGRDRLRTDVDLPIIFTEGSKKGASIYSNTGRAAIALNGVRGGYQLTAANNREIAEHLEEYEWEGRQVMLWFDRDPVDKVKTLRDVSLAIHVFGRLLEREGATVEVAQMEGPAKGKLGADDYLAKGGKMTQLKIEGLGRWAERNVYVQQMLKSQQQAQRQELELENDDELER